MTRFLTAGEAREKAQNDSLVHDEIYHIESQILSAVDNNELSTTVTDSTMTAVGTTTAQEFYAVWRGSSTDRAKDNQMQTVLQHFLNLGYSIVRLQNGNNQVFKWEIKW